MWIVDTCVVLDVFENDPRFGRSSAQFLQRLLPEGLAVSPITMVELAAAFDGNLPEQKRFLDQAGIGYFETWSAQDTETTHAAWNAYVVARRTQKIAKRPLADLLIGGFAVNRQGLITRNPADFRRWYSHLVIREP